MNENGLDKNEKISTADIPKKNQKTIGKSVLIVIFLIIFIPVGLVLMWLISGWSKITKWIITILLVICSIVITVYVFQMLFPGKPGFYEPVEKWNQYKSDNFTFSYPDGTKISRDIVTPGMIEEVRVIYKGVDSTAFDISKVDPKLYNNSPASTILETYAEKVLAYNQARPKDFSSKLTDGRTGEVVKTNYNCLPDSAKDDKVKVMKIDGKKAYSFELHCAYQGPEGEYQLFGSIDSPGEFNQYYQPIPNFPDETHSYFYLEYNNSIYQIHFDYLADNISDESPGNVGGKILQTLKFK